MRAKSTATALVLVLLLALYVALIVRGFMRSPPPSFLPMLDLLPPSMMVSLTPPPRVAILPACATLAEKMRPAFFSGS